MSFNDDLSQVSDAFQEPLVQVLDTAWMVHKYHLAWDLPITAESLAMLTESVMTQHRFQANQ